MSRFVSGFLGLLCALPLSAQDVPLPPSPVPVQQHNDVPLPPPPPAQQPAPMPLMPPLPQQLQPAVPVAEEQRAPEEVLGLCALFPVTLPHWLLKDDYLRKGYFPAYPYAADQPGYMRFEPTADDGPGCLRTRAGRFSLDYGNDFHGLERFGIDLTTETSSRFGFRLHSDNFYEHFSCGCWDNFGVDDVDLTYRFAQSNCLQMYVGVGMRVVDTSVKEHFGYNFTYGADLFPVKPIVLSLQMDAGAVECVGIFHTRATVGVLWRRFELFTGYDYLNIGGVDLQGMLGGLRLWY
jgi:hypothetical protein